MSKVFYIGDSSIEILGNIEVYNEIWKKLLYKSQEEIAAYKKFYDDEINIDEIIKKGYVKGIQSIDNVFLSFADLFINEGYFDFSAEYLKNNQKYQTVIQDFQEAFDDIEKKVDSLDNYEKAKALEREMAKRNRYKIRGGGFGLAGAAKGIVQAEAINLTSGLVYSGFNLIGNFFTSMSVAETKSDLYKKSKDYLCMCLYKSMIAVMDILVDELKLGVLFFPEKAEKIIENIDKGIINGDTVKIALNEALRQNPYNDKIYTQYCLYYNIFEKDIVNMAYYFGIDLDGYIKSLHEYNNCYFNNIGIAYLAKQVQEELNKDFNKMYRYDFSEKMFDDNFWITCDNQDLLKYIINAYQDVYDKFKTKNLENEDILKNLEIFTNISNFDELQSYLSKNINYFKEKLNLLINTGCCIKRYSHEELRKAIFDLLDKYELGKKERNIYLGNFISKEDIREAEHIFTEELKDSDIYVYIKANSHYGIKEDIFLFTDKGAFWGNKDTKRVIEFDDISEVKVCDKIFSNYDSIWVSSKSNPENLISLDDEHIYYISEKGRYVSVKAEYIVKIINEILNMYKNDQYIEKINKIKEAEFSKENQNIENNDIQEFNLLSFFENKYKFLKEKEGVYFGNDIPKNLLNKAISDYAFDALNQKVYLLIFHPKFYSFNSMLLSSKGLYVCRYEDSKIVKESYKFIKIYDLNKYGVNYDEGIVYDSIQFKERDIYSEIFLEKELHSIVNFMNQIIPIVFFEYTKSKSKYYGVDCAILGDLYKTGKGVKQNLLEAIYSYYKGIILFNDKWCLYEFGNCYYDGCYFSKDLAKAKYWFTKANEMAIAQGNTNDSNIIRAIENKLNSLENIENITDSEAFSDSKLQTQGFKDILNSVQKRRCEEEKHFLTKYNIESIKNLAIKYFEDVNYYWSFYPKNVLTLNNNSVFNFVLGRMVTKEDVLMAFYLNGNNAPDIVIFKWGIIGRDNFMCLFYELKNILLINEYIYFNHDKVLKFLDENIAMKCFGILTKLFKGEYLFNNITEEKQLDSIVITSSEITLTEQEIINYSSSYKSVLRDIYWIKDIPYKKLKNVLSTYANTFNSEDIIILYDNTIFGSAKEGFIIYKYGMKNSKGEDIKFKDIRKIISTSKALDFILIDNNRVTFWEFYDEKVCSWFSILLGALLNGEYIYEYEGIYPKCDSIIFNILEEE